MAKATSKTSWGTVLLMIFMVFWVLLATAAKGEAPSGRNEAKGTDIAERPIQDEDNTSKKKLIRKICKIKNSFFSFSKKKYVYVLQEGNHQIAKVGCTVDPKKRKINLQGGNFRELNYIKVFELKKNSDKFLAEKVAQKYLEDHKYAFKFNLGGGTEWYNTEKFGITEVAEKVKESLKKSGDYKADVTDKFTKL